MSYNYRMPKKNSGGYIGLILLLIATTVVGATSFFFYKNTNSIVPDTISEKINNELAFSSSDQLASIIATEVSSSTATTTPSETISEDTNVDVETNTVPIKKSLPANTTTKTNDVEPPTPVETTVTESEVSEVVSEPTLFVEAGSQPSQTLLLPDARRVPFTSINLTAKGGDINVESLVVERRGLASDRIFTEVGVVDIDSERALNANHQYSANDPFTIADGETWEIILFGNITDQETLASYDSQMPSLALVEIKTKSKISGSLPVVGTAHIANSNLVIGSMELTGSRYDPGLAKNIDIGSNSITFSGVRATAGSAEPILLTSFSWIQNGSMSNLDLANVKICIDNRGVVNCYPTEIDKTGKYYTSDFGDNVKIDKGDSVDIYIKGDVLASGVSRTINFDIGSSYDVWGYGLNYKNTIYSFGGELDGDQPEGSFSTSEGPFYNGYAHTIRGGSFNSIGR